MIAAAHQRAGALSEIVEKPLNLWFAQGREQIARNMNETRSFIPVNRCFSKSLSLAA
jgi:hypothetical protein